MQVSIIVAMANNNAIGKDNKMPWHLPADLKHFRQLTTGHYIIMGRKTYESIGKPLPNRTSVIITRNTDYKAEGGVVVESIEEALEKAKGAGEKEVFIIGGAQIYEQTISMANRIYLTKIDADFEADTFFPKLSKEWKEAGKKEVFSPDEKNAYTYSFLTLER